MVAHGTTLVFCAKQSPLAFLLSVPVTDGLGSCPAFRLKIPGGSVQADPAIDMLILDRLALEACSTLEAVIVL